MGVPAANQAEERMPMTESEDIVRATALQLMKEIERHSKDEAKLRTGVTASVRDLLERPDLLSLGVYRKGNHITNSKYLYYDGRLQLTLDQFPKGKVVPPHDHGTWEALAIYRGRVKHTVYERIDDGSRPGHAELRIVDDRILEHGDVAMVVPPAEIHAFTALTDDTYSLTIVGDHYAEERRYYDYEAKTYVVRQPGKVEIKAA
jgi:predicted metal-dependent enzyme (double-stranded beta helix superfamily)